MGSEHNFYDYIDANGANVINAWLNGNGKEAKAHFNRVIDWLEGSLPAGSQETVWRDPYVWPLHDEWKGFCEIRKKVRGVEYRLIAKVEERNVFLVTWGYHKGNWKTDITAQTAKERVNEMKNDALKYRKEHDNS